MAGRWRRRGSLPLRTRAPLRRTCSSSISVSLVPASATLLADVSTWRRTPRPDVRAAPGPVGSGVKSVPAPPEAAPLPPATAPAPAVLLGPVAWLAAGSRSAQSTRASSAGALWSACGRARTILSLLTATGLSCWGLIALASQLWRSTMASAAGAPLPLLGDDGNALSRTVRGRSASSAATRASKNSSVVMASRRRSRKCARSARDAAQWRHSSFVGGGLRLAIPLAMSEWVATGFTPADLAWRLRTAAIVSRGATLVIARGAATDKPTLHHRT